jgi:hypothetical protein
MVFISIIMGLGGGSENLLLDWWTKLVLGDNKLLNW